MEPPAAVKAAIHEILAAVTSAVEARDLESALALYSPDADAVLVSAEMGGTARGPVEIEAFLQRFFAQPFTFRWRWDDVRTSMSGSVAWVFADGEATRIYDSGARDVTPYRMTLVLENRDGRWIIQHYHGSAPIAPGSFGKT
jgi:uncharacterized protein (TIGR02246 family)